MKGIFIKFKWCVRKEAVTLNKLPIANHDCEWGDWCRVSGKEGNDAGLDDVVGTSTIHEGSYRLTLDVTSDTNGPR